jgi:hypothetical protein
LKDVAGQFGLDPFYPVMVQKVDPRDVTVDFMELTFKDQFVSRADIWRVKVAMFGKCVYVGKNVAALGVRSQVEALLSANRNVMCGAVGADTKMIVRSRSSRLIWLVQMSTEMWEFAPDGELYYEKMLNRLLKVLISKWSESSVSHSVTIIAFSRSYYDKNQFPDDYDPTSEPFRDPTRQGFGPGCSFADSALGYGPTVHVDPVAGRYYEDFYKVVVMNYTGPDWGHLLKMLKQEFVQYPGIHRWRNPEEFIRAEYDLEQVATQTTESTMPTLTAPSSRQIFDMPNNAKATPKTYVKWRSLPYGLPSRAIDGNILEAINVTLNILDKHYMDRDLNRTGQNIVMLTAGSSVFRVKEHLVDVTKQRMMDNGVGIDMISLATPPLHAVPLFICQSRWQASRAETGEVSTRASTVDAMMRSPSSVILQPSPNEVGQMRRSDNDSGTKEFQPTTFYIVPHWVNISFLEFDCQCSASVLASTQHASSQTKKEVPNGSFACKCQVRLNTKFTPLPPFRMFDVTAPTRKSAFPIALSNMMKGCKSEDEEDSHQDADDSPQRRLSFSSDTPSINFGDEHWRLSKSPDFVVNPSPRLDSLATAGTSISISLMTREALEEYDADVFTPAAWKGSASATTVDGEGVSSPPFDDDIDFTSQSLTGDMLSIINSKTSSRWKSVSSHAAVGSSNLVQSILSPRNAMPQSRVSTFVDRQASEVGRLRRDISAQSLAASNFHSSSASSTVHTKTGLSRSSTLKTSPLFAPPVLSARRMPLNPTEKDRSITTTLTGAVSEPITSDGTDCATTRPATSEESSPPSRRQLSRSIRSPPVSASAMTTFLPSPVELSGSFQKSFLTGNGMHPGIRRSESDQTNVKSVTGSYPPNNPDPSSSVSPQTSLHGVNPFRYSSGTLECTAARITSDRRRWIHLFPTMSNATKQTHLGPNWKSLTSPAILPLTTDYQPSPKELYTSYHESFYTLTLPSTDGALFPKYKNHDELLIEMICQRLASDFQLVAQEAGADVDITRNRVLLGSANRGPSGESRDTSSNQTIYNLSMGHRIHQIIYDAELQAIEVKRFVDRASQGEHNEPVVYKYSLWVDRTESFHPLQQNFYQYPMPEDNWNSLDHLLCGYLDDMSDVIKCRRIRFVVLPPATVVLGTRADKEAYALRFTKFVDYLQTRVASEHGAQEKIRVKVSVDPLPSPNLRQQVNSLSYKMSCDSMASYMRLKSEDPRNEWLMMHVEDTMQVDKSYHFDVRWLACSGIIVDDFISTIRRKAKQAGLELRRIPEYTSVSFLQIHPLIAPTFLPMPLEIMQNSDRETALINALVNRLEFILDDEKLAESRGIGYGLGIGKEEQSSQDAASRATARSQRRARSNEELESQLLVKWRRRGYKQYIHRQAPVFLRLIHNGVVWIPSYDYDQISTPLQVDKLFQEICGLIQASITSQDMVS